MIDTEGSEDTKRKRGPVVGARRKPRGRNGKRGGLVVSGVISFCSVLRVGGGAMTCTDLPPNALQIYGMVTLTLARESLLAIAVIDSCHYDYRC